MNKMKIRILLLNLFAALMLFSSCSDSDIVKKKDDNGIMKFLVQHPSVATRATSSNFELDDKIGVFVVKEIDEASAPLQVSGNHTNNELVTFNGATWESRKPIFWPTELVDIYAYYPYMEIISVDAQPFSVKLDQSSPERVDILSGYEASDFLWTMKSGLEYSEKPVPLQFKHTMSKLVIKLVKGADYEGELPENAEIFIHNTVPSALIDLATGVVLKDPYGKPGTIKCRKVSNDQFEAIIVPQRIETRRPLIEIVANDIAYLLEDNFNFRVGMQHTLNLVINSSPEQIRIEIDPSTGDWD